MAIERTGGALAKVRGLFVQIGRSWEVYLFLGVVSVVVGIIVLIWPGHTLVALGVLFGIQLIVAGLFYLLDAVVSPDAPAGSRAMMAILGLLGLVIGLYALRHVDIAVTALALVLGIYWICNGIVGFFAAIDYPGIAGQILRIVVGVLAITAGTIVIIWPHPSLLILAVILGVWLLMFGVLQIVIAIGIRAGAEPPRLGTSDPDRKPIP